MKKLLCPRIYIDRAVFFGWKFEARNGSLNAKIHVYIRLSILEYLYCLTSPSPLYLKPNEPVTHFIPFFCCKNRKNRVIFVTVCLVYPRLSEFEVILTRNFRIFNAKSTKIRALHCFSWRMTFDQIALEVNIILPDIYLSVLLEAKMFGKRGTPFM